VGGQVDVGVEERGHTVIVRRLQYGSRHSSLHRARYNERGESTGVPPAI